MKEKCKSYFKLFLVIAFFAGNYFAIEGAINLLNYNNDFTVFGGALLLAFTVLTDIDLVKKFFKSKEENKNEDVKAV